MTQKTALIAGATGLVGSALLELLLNSDAYSQVTVLTRRPLKRSHPKLKEVEINFDELENYTDQLRADVFFCCLGTTMKKAGSKEKFYKVDYEYPQELGKIAKTNGAGQFHLVSAMGANANSSIFYNRVKGEIEATLANMQLPSLQIYRPALLTGDRKEHRTGEKISITLFKVVDPLLVGGLKKYRSIPAATVAKAMYKTSRDHFGGVKIFESDQLHEIGE